MTAGERGINRERERERERERKRERERDRERERGSIRIIYREGAFGTRLYCNHFVRCIRCGTKRLNKQQ